MRNNLADVKCNTQNDDLNNADWNGPPKNIVRFKVVAEWNDVFRKTFEIFNIHTHHEDSESTHEELADGADDDSP